MEKIKEITKKYSKEDTELIKDTIDELCNKGIAKGCFKDYAVLCDVIAFICEFENIVSKN